MAFYKDVPGKRPQKNNYADQGSWDDEGTHYRGAGRRFGPGADNASNESRGYRSFSARRSDDRPARKNRAGEHNPQKQFGDNARNGFRRGERKDFRNERTQMHGEFKREDRFENRREPTPVKSYRDFEHHAAPARPERVVLPVEREENLIPENLLTGRNPIREALKSGRDIEKLMIQRGDLSGSAREILQMAKDAHIIIQEVDKSRLDDITPHHQGMVAFASAYQYSTVEAILSVAEEREEDPFVILLDGITDPHNLGAIIRSAECVGAHGVIVPERRSVGLTPAAVKASAGAIEHIKVARVTNLNRTIEMLKERGIWTYALTMDGEDYQKVNFKGGVALIVGAEGEGVSRLTLDNCDVHVSLPMEGKIDSLNASVAAGIMMYRVHSSRKA